MGNVNDDSDDGIETDNLLTKIEWKVLPLLDVRYDLRSNTKNVARRGYTLINGGITTSRRSIVSLENSSFTLIAPASASVEARVLLSLQPYYSRTTLTEKTTLLQLFASIVGLAGIFSVFGILFQNTERFSGLFSKHDGNNGTMLQHHTQPIQSLHSIAHPLSPSISFDALNRSSFNLRRKSSSKLTLTSWPEDNVIENKNPVFEDPAKELSNSILNKGHFDDKEKINFDDTDVKQLSETVNNVQVSPANSWRGSKPQHIRR